MSALPPRDPLPGHAIAFRVDTRTGRDTTFWCRVRLGALPRLRGHCFWATDDEESLASANATANEPRVVLPRWLLLQYLPEYVRLLPSEREYIRRYCLERDPTYIRDSEIALELKIAGLVHGRTLTLKGQNSYHLSP